MAISSFSGSTGGASGFNDFVVDMNDTSNNVIDLGRPYAAGAYEISLATGASSFDIYAVDESGNSVGYTVDATLVVTNEFTQLAILGVSQTERLTFAFSGASNDANAEGTATGAGAYLENATPTDLPNQDDTATVTGGNFASDVQIFFESGATSTAAKNITRNDSTELIVTRPDALDPDLDPWTLRAVNPGVPEPQTTNANILSDTITAGALPVWVTTSSLTPANIGQSYTETLEATDADGSVTYAITSGTLPTGLSLDSSTGEISGTPSSSSETFTVTATDEGGNTNSKEFFLQVLIATGGTISIDGIYTIHTFESSDDFEAFQTINDLEYVVVAGGGGGGHTANNNGLGGGGGGAGGYRSSIDGESSGGGASAESKLTISPGVYPVTIGAGGSGGNGNSLPLEGNDSSLGSLITSIGGGRGANFFTFDPATSGGSGGGGTKSNGPGAGTAGQGFEGAPISGDNGGQGGGAGAAGIAEFDTSPGVTTSITGSPIEFAQGGGGGHDTPPTQGETANTAGSGGGGRYSSSVAASGKDGIVIVRYVA